MAGKKDDIHVIQYCAKQLQPNLKSITENAKNILRRKNIEDIHDIRVASRRIRTCIDIFVDYLPEKKAKSWLKDIKIITKSFGGVRDLDVQLDLIHNIYSLEEDRKLRSGLRRVMLRLKQKRQIKQSKTKDITSSLLESTTIMEMATWVDAVLGDELQIEFTRELYQAGYEKIQNRLEEFLFFEVFIFDPTRIEELHQMRISAKGLRYALEVFSNLYQKKTDFALEITKQTQQYLGEIHDCDVWVDYLPKFLEKEYERIKGFYGYTSPFSRIKPGIQFLINNRQEKRDEIYEQFIEDWKGWKLKETWLNLRKIIFLTSLEDPPIQPNSTNP